MIKLPEQIIKRPLLTEKGTAMGEAGNKVLFEVAMDANKIEIRKAVEKIYNVKVTSVHTQLVRGKIEAARPPRRQAPELEAGHRDPGRRVGHRLLRADVGRGTQPWESSTTSQRRRAGAA